MLAGLGIAGHEPKTSWFGEPPAADRETFLTDCTTVTPEADAARLWRRYGQAAPRVLDRVRAHPAEGRELFPGTGLIEAEVHHAARAEMVVQLSDFLRRRTLLEMVRGKAALRDSGKLERVAGILAPGNPSGAMEHYLAGSP